MKSDTRFKYILSFRWKAGNLKKLNDWFEIDEQEYLMYLLKGYDITIHEKYVEWVFDGKPHREDGPAYTHVDGSEIWSLAGKWHREEGPAVIDSSGYKEWWLNDIQYTEAGYNAKIKQLV